MLAIPKIPETSREFQTIVEYLQSKTIPNDIQRHSTKKSNFIRRYKKFKVDNNFLYIRPIVKDGKIILEKRRIIPKYDKEMRALILGHFYNQSNYQEYHKTFSAISEKHIGITQEEVKAYVNQCPACAVTTSIKEKTDMRNVISLNKEASTVAGHLLKDVFKILGPSTILQSNNGSSGTTAASETTITTKTTVTTETTTASETTAASDNTTPDTTIPKTTISETTTPEMTTNKAAMEQRISHMLEIRQSINALLEKYRTKLGRRSVHTKKTANNTIETGTEVTIAPDYNMNQQTRKRKPQPNFSARGVFKSLKTNNHTAAVEMDGKNV
ncbi:hypothetical protein C2G38_2202619 [Gigaspora rosea]|uniref:Uncharacterized protein n=1 Tax=Gigaspora rosea TaxID=44941 RepID=A0A397UW59_9GLOM|nr:hypothetical protein C2G38_2202619 [Gigaspora rosea]